MCIWHMLLHCYSLESPDYSLCCFHINARSALSMLVMVSSGESMEPSLRFIIIGESSDTSLRATLSVDLGVTTWRLHACSISRPDHLESVTFIHWCKEGTTQWNRLSWHIMAFVKFANRVMGQWAFFFHGGWLIFVRFWMKRALQTN